VVFYGHYDVQPALEPDWATRPFELAAVDGYLYGRGTSDNKGPMLSFIYAVKVGGGGCIASHYITLCQQVGVGGGLCAVI
jgi:hypothetical protein